MLRTLSGKYIDYLNPQEDSILVKDILHSLARLPRFVGHSYRVYTVGEHTLICDNIASLKSFTKRERLLVLLHDFTEAYVNDVPAPLKRLLPRFSEIEEAMESVIYKKLKVKPPTEEEYLKIKMVDLTALAIEMKSLTSHNYKEFMDDRTFNDVVEDSIIARDFIPQEEKLVKFIGERLAGLLGESHDSEFTGMTDDEYKNFILDIMTE